MQNGHAYAPFFQIHQLFGAAAVDGFDAADWSEAPTADLNHATWILTHVVGVRRTIARNLGHEIAEEAWEKEADFGFECQPAERYPAPEALMEEFGRLGQWIGEGLAQADSAQFDHRFEPDFPDGRERTIGEALPFLIAHEALHLGQLSYLRRLRGREGLANVALRMMGAQTA